MAVTLLDLALIFTSITNTQDSQERRLQKIISDSIQLAKSVQETRTELKALLEAKQMKLQALTLIDRGLTDLEKHITSDVDHHCGRPGSHRCRPSLWKAWLSAVEAWPNVKLFHRISFSNSEFLLNSKM
ncbi:hypothetical protein Btru_034251 [Bulinus truncatus]|nr:hypothetical protein Btru_034251 [Bulinus truncatus]